MKRLSLIAFILGPTQAGLLIGPATLLNRLRAFRLLLKDPIRCPWPAQIAEDSLPS